MISPRTFARSILVTLALILASSSTTYGSSKGLAEQTDAPTLREQFGPYIMSVAQSYKVRPSKEALRQGITPWSQAEYEALELGERFAPGNERVAPKVLHPSSGLMAVLHWGLDREIIVSFAGADLPTVHPNTWMKWFSRRLNRNLKTFFANSLSEMDVEGLKLVRRIRTTYPNRKVTIVGHSLGSRTAQYIALAENLTTICFAPLGLTEAEIESAMDIRKFKSRNLLKKEAKRLIKYVVGDGDAFFHIENSSLNRASISTLGFTLGFALGKLNIQIILTALGASSSTDNGALTMPFDLLGHTHIGSLVAVVPALYFSAVGQDLIAKRGSKLGRIVQRLPTAGHLANSIRDAILGARGKNDPRVQNHHSKEDQLAVL